MYIWLAQVEKYETKGNDTFFVLKYDKREMITDNPIDVS